MGRRLLPLLTAVLAALLLAAGWLWTGWSRSAPADAPVVEVDVPKGASLAATARILEEEGVIDSAFGFRVAARFLGGTRPVRHGPYAFPAGEGWRTLLRRLQRGDVLILRLVIPEGMPSVLVYERLKAAPRLEGDVAVPPEGSILPATWEYRPGEARSELLARMQAGMAATLAEEWGQRSRNAAVRSPEEAVILASIVEKERGPRDDPRRIAGLYSNRLREGMRLQADPTVIYPVTRGKPLGRRIRQSELRADNGWNTYARAGLPKTPITNPGRDAIRAVLDPEANDYRYMVADGEGGHAFAATYEVHQANVAKWYALRRERGEM
jgi:UPF0755 protein